MKRLAKNIVLALIIGIAFYSCKSFETQALDDNDKLAVDEGQQIGDDALTTNRGYIDDFKSFRGYWWGGAKVSPTIVGDTLITMVSDAGNKYECWGMHFSAIDMTKAPVLKIRARYEGNTVPTLGVSLKDVNEYDTNLQRPSARLKKGGYTDYYFNYTGKWKQGWPDSKNVDPSTISDILFFVNPGAANWTGKVYIDYIKVVTVDSIPAKKPRPEASTTAPVETTIPNDGVVNSAAINIAKSAPAVNIDDFSGGIYSWWSSSNDKISLSKDNNMLKISLEKVGPAFETFGRGFKSIDFNKTPIVKVRLKSAADMPGNLRVDLKDIDGFVTNAKPVVMKFESNSDFVDYYYDFTGKFEQGFPNMKNLDPSQIIEMVFLVNPGGSAYTGTLYFSDIKAISVEEFNNRK